MLFLAAIVKAVDEYQDLLRITVASAGNDHRLGANEAPPAVISIFLGDELIGVLDAIENETEYEGAKKKYMKLGVDVLPQFRRDTTDRNRTSPFAFTGNKFEFRMLGSSNSIACCNMMLNSAVAESLKQFADVLENSDNFENDVHTLIRDTIKAHKRIIFNGNGYDDAWLEEAEKRGLSNLRTTADAMPHLLDEKNVAMLTAHKVFTEAELESRLEIMLENYVKQVNIEALTMVDMTGKQILPAIESYLTKLLTNVTMKKAISPDISCAYETANIEKLSAACDEMSANAGILERLTYHLSHIDNIIEQADFVRDEILPQMDTLREYADDAEAIVDSKIWPLPTYGELLFGVR